MVVQGLAAKYIRQYGISAAAWAAQRAAQGLKAPAEKAIRKYTRKGVHKTGSIIKSIKTGKKNMTKHRATPRRRSRSRSGGNNLLNYAIGGAALRMLSPMIPGGIFGKGAVAYFAGKKSGVIGAIGAAAAIDIGSQLVSGGLGNILGGLGTSAGISQATSY